MGDREKMSGMIAEAIQQNITADAWEWLQSQTGYQKLNTAFMLVPRKTGKAITVLPAGLKQKENTTQQPYNFEGWANDKLCRLWLLLQLDVSEPEQYFGAIENLFLAGEMNELVALYAALPFLAFPDAWVKRCAEGLRSNIASVLEAIMYGNPYPANNLGQDAWNQMVVKAFFTDKKISLIVGLDDRANKKLAYTLTDYARERWAAGRTVNPILWQLVSPFIDEKVLADIAFGLPVAGAAEKNAIALAIKQSNFMPAKDLLRQYPELEMAEELTWASFAL